MDDLERDVEEEAVQELLQSAEARAKGWTAQDVRTAMAAADKTRARRSPSMSSADSIPGRAPIRQIQPKTPVLQRYNPQEVSEDESTDDDEKQGEIGVPGEPQLRRRMYTYQSNTVDTDLTSEAVRTPVRQPGALDAPPAQVNRQFSRSMSFAASLPAIPVAQLRDRRLRKRSSVAWDYAPSNTDGDSSAPILPPAFEGSAFGSSVPPERPPSIPRSAVGEQNAPAPFARQGPGFPAPAPAFRGFRRGRVRGPVRPVARPPPAPAARGAPRGDPLRVWKLWRDAFGWSDPQYRQDWITGRLYGRTRRRQRLFTPPAQA